MDSAIKYIDQIVGHHSHARPGPTDQSPHRPTDGKTRNTSCDDPLGKVPGQPFFELIRGQGTVVVHRHDVTLAGMVILTTQSHRVLGQISGSLILLCSEGYHLITKIGLNGRCSRLTSRPL